MSTSIDKRQNLFKSCIKELQSCVDYIQQYSDNKSSHCDVIKDIAKDYCEIDFQCNRAQGARDAVDKHFDNQENDCTEDIQELYNRYLEEQVVDVDYQDHPIWHKITNVIQGEHAEAQPESSNDELEADENESIVEESIIASQFEPPIDPITKKIIENPCRNKKCGHIYEFETVMYHLTKIKQNKAKVSCPYIGCANTKMKSTFIIKDGALKQRIQNYLANTRKAAEIDTSQSSSVIL